MRVSLSGVDVGVAVPYEETFDGHIGLTYVSVSPELVEATISLRQGMTTAPGWLQTGIASAVAESMASMGTASAVIPQGNAAMGKWNDTTVVAAATGTALSATARPIAQSDEQWLWDVRVEDAAESLVATSRVAIAVRPRPR